MHTIYIVVYMYICIEKVYVYTCIYYIHIYMYAYSLLSMAFVQLIRAQRLKLTLALSEV